MNNEPTTSKIDQTDEGIFENNKDVFKHIENIKADLRYQIKNQVYGTSTDTQTYHCECNSAEHMMQVVVDLENEDIWFSLYNRLPRSLWGRLKFVCSTLFFGKTPIISEIILSEGQLYEFFGQVDLLKNKNNKIT